MAEAKKDIYSKEKRSAIMSRVKSRDTELELEVRSEVHRAGYRFRLHVKELPGKPDIVLPKYKLAVFIHGCFWHQHEGCKKAKLPSSNIDFWREKLTRNRVRDESNKTELEKLGWKVVVIWGCALKQGLANLLALLGEKRRSK